MIIGGANENNGVDVVIQSTGQYFVVRQHESSTKIIYIKKQFLQYTTNFVHFQHTSILYVDIELHNHTIVLCIMGRTKMVASSLHVLRLFDEVCDENSDVTKKTELHFSYLLLCFGSNKRCTTHSSICCHRVLR